VHGCRLRRWPDACQDTIRRTQPGRAQTARPQPVSARPHWQEGRYQDPPPGCIHLRYLSRCTSRAWPAFKRLPCVGALEDCSFCGLHGTAMRTTQRLRGSPHGIRRRSTARSGVS
jgi:hypothetical protein